MQKIDWSTVKELGKMPDRELARKLGAGATTVREARHRLGIPSFVAPAIEPVANPVAVDPTFARYKILAKALFYDTDSKDSTGQARRHIFTAMSRLLKRSSSALAMYYNQLELCEDINAVLAWLQEVEAEAAEDKQAAA